MQVIPMEPSTRAGRVKCSLQTAGLCSAGNVLPFQLTLKEASALHQLHRVLLTVLPSLVVSRVARLQGRYRSGCVVSIDFDIFFGCPAFAFQGPLRGLARH